MNDVNRVFEPITKSIEQLLENTDSFYNVPEYQRPYSWEDENIEAMWDDIYSAFDRHDDSYFLGSMVFVSKKDKMEIVDGQQRIASLIILFSVIRDKFGEEIKKANTSLYNRIHNAIRSNINEESRLKFKPQIRERNKFEDEIVNAIKLNDKCEQDDTESKFLNAAKIFCNKVKRVYESGGIERLIDFVEYILTRVEVIAIRCNDMGYAINLFMILNDRGLQLTNSDLIKSYLLSNIEIDNEEGIEQFNSTWQSIADLEIQSYIDENLSKLFGYYYLYLEAKNPRKNIYDELKAVFEKKFREKPSDKSESQLTNEIIYEFYKFAYAIKENIYDVNSKIVYSLLDLQSADEYWKTIIATAKMKNFGDMEGLWEELRKLFYSNVIARYTSASVRQPSLEIIRKIKEHGSLEDIRQIISDYMRINNVCKRVIDNLKNNVYGKNWLKPVLALIEYSKTDDTKITRIRFDDRRIQIDHILPKKWKDEPSWASSWTEEDGKDWLDKIGNLTLLDIHKNESLQNASFDRKKQMYKNKENGITAFEISKEIAEKEDWLPHDVEERQRQMIIQILKILGLEYSEDDLIDKKTEGKSGWLS